MAAYFFLLGQCGCEASTDIEIQAFVVPRGKKLGVSDLPQYIGTAGIKINTLYMFVLLDLTS